MPTVPRRSSRIYVDAAWTAWHAGRPETTQRARLYDLRELAKFLRVHGRGDKLVAKAAARAIVARDASWARTKILAFGGWSAKRASPASVGRRLATISSWLRECQEHGLGWTVAIRRPKMPRYTARKCPRWSSVQARARRLDEPSDRAILWLLASCGLRRSELSGLRWSDVHERDDVPRVRITRKGGAIVERTIGALAAAELAAMRERANVFGDLAGDVAVFRGRRGARTGSGIARLVTSWGLGTPHALRRAGATELRRRGADPSTIQAWLGHASLATTAVYVRELDDAAGVGTRLLEAET